MGWVGCFFSSFWQAGAYYTAAYTKRIRARVQNAAPNSTSLLGTTWHSRSPVKCPGFFLVEVVLADKQKKQPNLGICSYRFDVVTFILDILSQAMHAFLYCSSSPLYVYF